MTHSLVYLRVKDVSLRGRSVWCVKYGKGQTVKQKSPTATTQTNHFVETSANVWSPVDRALHGLFAFLFLSFLPCHQGASGTSYPHPHSFCTLIFEALRPQLTQPHDSTTCGLSGVICNWTASVCASTTMPSSAVCESFVRVPGSPQAPPLPPARCISMDKHSPASQIRSHNRKHDFSISTGIKQTGATESCTPPCHHGTVRMHRQCGTAECAHAHAHTALACT